MHTKDTIMTNLATFRVHIAPLGFEIDRIVLPLKQTKADKLWILAHDNRSEDLSAPYLEKIKKECKKLHVEVKVAYSDRLSLFKAIKSIKDIISQEENNYIYVNVASGSKIQAIACMMACMVLKGAFVSRRQHLPHHKHGRGKPSGCWQSGRRCCARTRLADRKSVV